MTWTKSTFSGGGDCLEVSWAKSTYSTSGECVEVGWEASSYCNGGTCVEAARLAGKTVLIRDSKDPDGPWLSVDSDAWHAFLDAVSDGQYDPAP